MKKKIMSLDRNQLNRAIANWIIHTVDTTV